MTRPAERILYGERGPNGGTPFWRMATIWRAAEGREPVEVDIEGLGVLDQVVWLGGPHEIEPTVRRVAERARDIHKSDLGFPIIMTASGDVLDGAHRIAKAWLEGRRTIAAIVIRGWPPADGILE
jgi:hypothetical protein